MSETYSSFLLCLQLLQLLLKCVQLGVSLLKAADVAEQLINQLMGPDVAPMLTLKKDQHLPEL